MASSTSPSRRRRTPSPTKSIKSLKSFFKTLKLNPIDTFKPKRFNSPPKVVQYRTSSHPVNAQDLAFAPDLGDGGWGDQSWQKVKPMGMRQQLAEERLWDWQEGVKEEKEEDEDSGDEGSDIGIQRDEARTRHWRSTKASSNPRDTATPSVPHLPFTTPSRSRSRPHHAGSSSSRAPSVSSAASSSRTHVTPTHRTPSGSSYTAQGVNTKAVPTRRAAYTSQGMRVGSDGYAGKWKDPKKTHRDGEREEEGSVVWKGHPALQPRPGGGS